MTHFSLRYELGCFQEAPVNVGKKKNVVLDDTLDSPENPPAGGDPDTAGRRPP
jgi:hypothetical protein